MDMRKYYLPTKIIFGEKSFQQLFPELETAGIKHPLVICGSHFTQSFKYRDIEERIPSFEIFTEVEPNPYTATVDAAARILNSRGCDAVIGIGGGSVLDVSKVVACMKGFKSSCESFYRKVSVKVQVPFFSLPTTSGSGSEVTKYSVLTTKAGVKKTMGDKKFYARTAIIDPELTYSMPPTLTATTGVDAFCQAVEAYWAKTATPETDVYAAEAIGLAYHSLFKAVKDADRQVRHNMSLAALRAAQAFSNTGTTACHTISYPITKHFGVPHGFAVALTLPWFLGFYSGKRSRKCLEICDMLGAKTIADGMAKMSEFLQSVGAPASFMEIGGTREDFEKVISASLVHKPQNPAKHTRGDLWRMLGEIY